MGLYRAGFDVVGVDIKPQPRYPFTFIRGDALKPPVRLEDFDLVWASPPCQAFTVARAIRGREHPNLVPQTRVILCEHKLWVMENVPGSPLRPDLVLEGGRFGLRIRRQRVFEASFPLPFGMEQRWAGTVADGTLACVAGHGAQKFYGSKAKARNTADGWRDAMQMPWATQSEIAQAVPPAYSEHIGKYALMALAAQKPLEESPDGPE